MSHDGKIETVIRKKNYKMFRYSWVLILTKRLPKSDGVC